MKHKHCGGKVVWQKPTYIAHFEFAGLCLKCDKFPIVVEDIIFEKGDDTSRV